MEEMINVIIAVASTLRKLFAEKNELNGFEDWDMLIGCVIQLESLATQLNNSKQEKTTEG